MYIKVIINVQICYYFFQDDIGIRPFPKDLLNVDDTITHMDVFQTTNFTSLIRELSIKPFSKSRMFVSLHHLSPLPLVEPILENDVQFYFFI